MVVALRSSHSIGALIPVDNAPVDATLKSDFSKYVRGLRNVEEAKVTKSAEADDILRKFEEVSEQTNPNLWCKSEVLIKSIRRRPYRSGSSSLQTSCDRPRENFYICAYRSRHSPQAWIIWVISRSRTRTKHAMMALPCSFGAREATTSLTMCCR